METIGSNVIKIGANSNKEGFIYISEEARASNLLILGIGNSGKSKHMLPLLLEQDIKNKNVGITVVVSDKDSAFRIYAIAKKYKRNVKLLKPEISINIVNEFLWKTDWDYDYINENIINYKDAIKDKDVVIIDMESYNYRNYSHRAVASLLLQLQTDMCNPKETLKRRHNLYIDNADKYLPFIELLLTNGNNYGLYTTLLMQSRSQLEVDGKDYSILIDNNILNTILMQNITFEDAEYYAKRWRRKDMSVDDMTFNLYRRKYGTFSFEILGMDNNKRIGEGVLYKDNESNTEETYNSAKKYRKKLKTEFTNEVLIRNSRVEAEAEMLKTDKSNVIKDSETVISDIDEVEEVKIVEKEDEEELEEIPINDDFGIPDNLDELLEEDLELSIENIEKKDDEIQEIPLVDNEKEEFEIPEISIEKEKVDIPIKKEEEKVFIEEIPIQEVPTNPIVKNIKRSYRPQIVKPEPFNELRVRANQSKFRKSIYEIED